MNTSQKEPTFKMGSLFDGSGGFPLASVLCGIKPVWASEIEPFPIRVTKARFPNMKHYGDISKIDVKELETVDLISGGSPCFIAGTLIQTERGIVPIEEVSVGDKVLTHTNIYQLVEKIGNQQSSNIIDIKLLGTPVITTTENHPFYVRKSKRDFSTYYVDGQKKRRNNKGMLDPEWLAAKDLKKGYYVGFSINNESKNEKNLTECECWLIGRYIADGYINESRRKDRKNCFNHKVIYCVGKGKLEEFKDNATDYHVCAKENRTATKCEIISQRLVDLCKECGKGAINKTIPQFVMDLPPELLEKALDGYMSGDGSYNRNYKATTISKNLAYQLQHAIAKVYHTYARIYFTKRPETYVIEGRTVNQHDTYQINFQKEIRKQDKYIYSDGMLWIPFVESQTKDKSETVYNMQVANDNSYTAYNFTVHNCQDMSVAGKRQGMSKKCPKCSYSVVGNAEIKECPECGAELEYTRSGLFMDQIRIVKEMREKDELEQLRSGRTVEHIRPRPRFMLWENVVGAFSSNGGEDFRAVLEETAKIKDPAVVIPRPPKGKWPSAGCIVGDGYSVAWRVLDAQYWGVPQRRRRIALVADFGGECAGEILFKREGLRRNFTESRKAWQGITGNLAESFGEASEPICYNGENLTSPLNKQNPQPGDPCHTLGTDPRNYAMIPQFAAGFCTEHSAKARSIGYEEVKAPTLRAGVVPAIITENQQQYSVDFGRTADRIQMNADKAVTLLGEGGGGGAKTGLYCLPKEPYVMNERQYACTVTQGTANTLTGTDYKGTQCVFEPVKIYGIGGYNSEGMKSSNPHSGFYEADTSRTLDLNGGNPACNQGGIAICEPVYAFEPGIAKREGSESRFVEDCTPTLRATMGDNQIATAYSFQDKKRIINLNKDDVQSKAVIDPAGIAPSLYAGECRGGGGECYIIDKSPTYDIDRAAFNQGENAKYDFSILDEQTPTLIARGPNAVCHATDVGWLSSCEDVSPTLLSRMYKDPHLVTYQSITGTLMASGYNKLGTQEAMNDMFVANEYIVRRLTPLECSRLQGFPDWWCDGLQNENPTEEDLKFWREVFETHREIVTGTSKPKTDKQIIKWLKEEPNDGAQYKLWGNGIALPCFLYVIEGIKEVLDRTSISNSSTTTSEEK